MEGITLGISTAEQSQVALAVEPDEDAEDLRRELVDAVMKEKWQKVLEIYEQHPAAWDCSITRRRENSLHLMVMWAGGDAIRGLADKLNKLDSEEAEKLLALKDAEGGNALHAAAARGTTLLCKVMGRIAPELITARNVNGETPLFRTFISGSTSAFLTFCNFAELSNDEQFMEACTRKDGTTVLHLAIYREHFELAFNIIKRCPKIVNAEDCKHETPLVFLARKRHLFKSSYHLSLCQQFIYSVIKVSQLQLRENYNQKIPSTTYAKYCSWLQFFNKDQCEDGFEEEPNNPWEAQYCMLTDAKRRDAACISFSKRAALAILGIGTNVQKILKMKEKHVHAKQIMKLLIEHATLWQYDPTENEENPIGVSPLIVAAEVGVTEIVEEILEQFPVASQDVDDKGKNVVLVSIENRHPHIYRHLQKKCLPKDFTHVDNKGNSALHLAANVGRSKQSWIIPGAALHMQWEIKWYEFVKTSFRSNYFFSLYNSENKTPHEVFVEEHQKMVEERAWLKDTATSGSVIVALIATVAFASAVTIPGGVKTGSGTPVHQQDVGLGVFAISSLMALCFSIISLILFLSILTSRFKENAFKTMLPVMLIGGLTFQLLAISSILVSFCAGHFFIVNHRQTFNASRRPHLPMYAITCLSASLFAMSNFNLYKDLIISIIKNVPERSYLTVFDLV